MLLTYNTKFFFSRQHILLISFLLINPTPFLCYVHQFMTPFCVFISVINQLDAQNFCFTISLMTLHVSSTCTHHQEVKIALHSLWYHHTYRWWTIWKRDKILLLLLLLLLLGYEPRYHRSLARSLVTIPSYPGLPCISTLMCCQGPVVQPYFTGNCSAINH